MSNFSNPTFINPLSQTDRTIKIYDEDLNIRHTINAHTVKNVFVVNNLIKISLNSDRVITLDFNSSNEATLALPKLKQQIDQLSNKTPLRIDKPIEEYIQGMGLSYSNGNLFVNANMIPVSGSYSIGSSASLWKDIFVSTSSVHIGGATISSDGNAILMDSLGLVSGTNSLILTNDNGFLNIGGLTTSMGTTGPTGATGPQGIQGATGPQGPTGGGLGLLNGSTVSIPVGIMNINSIRTEISNENFNFFTTSAIFDYPYTFTGDIATYSTTIQPGNRPYTQTVMTGLFSVGELFPGLDMIATYKYYMFGERGITSSYLESSEFQSSGIISKYTYIYAGLTPSNGLSASTQHRHRFYYNDYVETYDSGDVSLTYDGTMSYTYSNDINEGLSVENSFQIGKEYNYGFGFIGTHSLFMNGTYSNVTKPTHSDAFSVYVGQDSAQYISSGDSATASAFNVAVGHSAMKDSVLSSFNVAVGFEAGKTAENAFNTYIGTSAGRYDKGTYNTYIGTNAGQSSTASSNTVNNTFIGINSGQSSLSGSGNNTFVGANSGSDNTTGGFNTFFGAYSGVDNTEGDNNTFIGAYSGFNHTTGTNNLFIGHQSGYDTISASASVIIGGYSTELLGSLSIENIYLADGNGNLRYHYDGTQSIIKDNLKVEGALDIGAVSERYGQYTTSSNTHFYDCTSGNIFYHESLTSPFKVDLINLQENDVNTITIILEQSGTIYQPESYLINGVTHSVKWSNGTYSFNSDQTDIIGLSILKTGTSSTILGQTNTFN